MPILYKEWALFNKATLIGHDLGGHDFNVSGEWTTDHVAYCMLGERRNIGADWDRWDSIFMPPESTFQLISGLNEPCAFSVGASVGIQLNNSVVTSLDLVDGIMEDPADPNAINWERVSGRYYDGVNNFSIYPHNTAAKGVNYQSVTLANLAESYTLWYPPGPANTLREDLFRNGYWIKASNYSTDPTAWANNKECRLSLTPTLIHVQYLNCAVNSISPMNTSTAAGKTIIFTGLGFNNTDADIAGGWPTPVVTSDMVDRIYFDGLQGQGDYTYTRIFPAAPPAVGQFNIDSNEQITLRTQAMAEGSYRIRMFKLDVNIAGQGRTFNITDYAGDWRCDDVTDGRVREGGRFSFRVTDTYLDPGGDPRARLTGGKMGGAGRGGGGGGGGVLLLTDWEFEHLDIKTLRHYSKLDTRAPTIFYEGRIMSSPSITRATDDMTGLPAVADMTIDLANNDLAMTKIMAEYLIVNRYVSLFAGFGNEPDAWREELLRCIVDDHEDMGPTWRFYLKDVSKKYSAVKIPKYLITKDEYPSAHEDAIGKAMPEALGLHTLIGEAKGAVKAHCTDTTAFEYLAARGNLKSITEVYSDGEDMAGHWAIAYRDGGRTYIDFDADQGDNDITFNCTGYMHAPWNSGTGYVRNPAYVLAFLIALIAEVPIELLDMNSFDDLATKFDDLGWEDTARLVVQDVCNLEEKIEELCFTFGIKMWFDRLGRYRVGKKTLCDLEADLIFFDEIDALTPATRKPHLRQAVNYTRVLWDYYPCADRFKESEEETRQSSVDDLKATREDSRAPWEFKWTDNEDIVAERIQELLMQRAYGYPRIYFSLPIVWFRDLDIFDNFWYQSHFGPSTTGEGEKQRLFYVESIGYDFDGNKMDIVGVDLSHLMAQCMIIGRCSEINANHTLAAPWMRAFGYIGDCTSGTFPNGDPNKLLCKCECNF